MDDALNLPCLDVIPSSQEAIVKVEKVEKPTDDNIISQHLDSLVNRGVC